MSKNSIVTPLSLRGNDFNQVNLLKFLRPLHEKNKNAGFGVGQYAGGIAVANAYNCGCYSPTQNRIYLSPLYQSSNANWHYIDCSTGEVVAYTTGLGTTLAAQAYSSMTYSPTQNRIYLTPYINATSATWHYIDCNTGAVVAYTHGATATGQAYSGAVYSPKQNRIYFAPYLQAAYINWHYLDCTTGAIVSYSAAILSATYVGACYSPAQDRIYFIPFGMSSQANWHYINCSTGSLVAYDHGFGTTIPANAYTGGCYSPTQNRIYFMPRGISSAADWHYINCNTGAIVAYTHGATVASSAFAGGCYSPLSNKIFLAPLGSSSSATWYYIDCNTGAVVPYNHGFGTTIPGSAYSGAVYSPMQNKIFFIPQGQSSQANWHYVKEYSASENTVALMSGAMFNKY